MKNYNKIYIDKQKRKERDEFNYLFKKLTTRIYIELYRSFNPQKDDKVSLQENAQNIAQDTIMAYLKKIEEGDIIQNREAWCTTVAKNRTIDFFRKKKPERISNYENSDDEENESKNYNKLEAIYEDKKNQDKSFYDILDDEFTVRLTKSEVIAKSFSKEEFAFENEDGDMETREVDNPFEFSSVKRLRLKEEWFFDNQRSVMETRIIGVCPVMEMFDEMGEYKGEKPLVWLYFPELRIPMSITAMFNTKNRAATITYDQLFMKRMFSSYIYKKSNVFDRKIDTYKQDLDLLLESKQIEHEIFEFEQDLWEY